MKHFLHLLLLSCFPSIFLLGQPTITTVTPNSAIQGQTINVSISGQNTYFQQGSTTAWLTQGSSAMVPTITTVQGWSQLTSVFSIPGNAGVGYWDLHVTDGWQGELLKLDAIFIDQFIGVDPRGTELKQSITLGPNPADDHFTLRYSLASKSMVQIQIRDLKGNLVQPLFVGEQSPGKQAFRAEIADLRLPGSTFLVTLQVDGMVFAVKASVLR